MHSLETIIRRNHPDGDLPEEVIEQRRLNALYAARDEEKIRRLGGPVTAVPPSAPRRNLTAKEPQQTIPTSVEVVVAHWTTPENS